MQLALAPIEIAHLALGFFSAPTVALLQFACELVSAALQLIDLVIRQSRPLLLYPALELSEAALADVSVHEDPLMLPNRRTQSSHLGCEFHATRFCVRTMNLQPAEEFFPTWGSKYVAAALWCR
jgi:hypothetical protein